jgi:Cell wall-active antibiotics response 4TMS YvqF
MNSPTSYPPAAVRPHPTLAPDQVPERRGAVALLSHTRRDADWVLPRLFRIFAFWGNAEIDLTHALVGAGTSTIEIRCIMASVQIVVPPDLRVESDVDAVLGSAEVKREISSTTSPDVPLIRITGSTLLGSIEIKIVDPNAPGFFEKIRRHITGA